MLSIQTNIMASTSLRSMHIHQASMDYQLEKLSSGKRINSAADDAAGFAIASNLQATKGKLISASENVVQSMAMLKQADGAVSEIKNIIHRLQVLSTRAASDHVGGSERTKLHNEAMQLINTIDKSVDSTRFNGIGLIDGSIGRQVQPNPLYAYRAYIPNVSGTIIDAASAGNYQLRSDNSATPGQKKLTLTELATGNSQVIDNITPPTSGTDTYPFSNLGISVDLGSNFGTTGSFTTTVIAGLGSFSVSDWDPNNYAINVSLGTTTGTKQITMTDNTTGVSQTIDNINPGDTLNFTSHNLTTSVSSYTPLGTSASAPISSNIVNGLYSAYSYGLWEGNYDMAVSAGTSSGSKITLTDANGDTYTADNFVFNPTPPYTTQSAALYDSNNRYVGGLSFNADPGTSGTATITVPPANGTLNIPVAQVDLQVTTGHADFVQIGSENTIDSRTQLGLGASYSSIALGISTMDISSRAGAQAAITSLNTGLSLLVDNQAVIGASVNKFQYIGQNLGTSIEQHSASASAIEDTDMAISMVEFTKSKIMLQASTAMTVQANQVSEQIFRQLLRIQ